MPVGPYETFGECVGAQKRKGKSDESARNICGAMERDAASTKKTAANHIHDRDGRFVGKGAPRVVEQFTNEKDKFFVRAFLIDPSLNLNKWRVTEGSIDKNISTFVGKPLVLTKDFEHPGADMDSLNHWLEYQEDFRVGTITEIVARKSDISSSTAYHAIIEITNKDLENSLRSNKVPVYVSPAIAEPILEGSMGSPPDVAIDNWTGIHLAIVSNPAYGIRRARITETCGGDRAGCLALLRKAQKDCDFCVKGAMERYAVLVASRTPRTNTSHGQKTSANPSKPMSTLETIDSTNKQEQQQVEKVEEPNTVNNNNTKQPVSIPPSSNTPTNIRDLLAENQRLLHELELRDLRDNEKDDAINTMKDRLAALELRDRRKDIERIITPDIIKDDKARLEKIKTLTSSSIPIKEIEEVYKDLRVTIKKASLNQRAYGGKVPYITSNLSTTNNNAGSNLTTNMSPNISEDDDTGMTSLQKQLAVLKGGMG